MSIVHTSMELGAQRHTAGISAANRQRLEQLHRSSSGPLTVPEAARILGIDPTATARLLAHWRSHGWVQRVRRGLYRPPQVPATSIGVCSPNLAEWTIARTFRTRSQSRAA